MISVDIFCNVIDNYGDAGVCLHLARTLSGHDFKVKLYCNNLGVLNEILNDADKDNHNLKIVSWEQALSSYDPSEVVISAFSCRFDEITLEELKLKPHTLVINLEYLSAESWVEDCHGLPSFVDGLTSHYFFPGFTKRTGGLNVDEHFTKFCQVSLDKIHDQIQHGAHTKTKNNERVVSLFGYKNEEVSKLLKAIESSNRHTKINVFTGLCLDNLNELLGSNLKVGDHQIIDDKLEVQVLPMLSHDGYDEILLSSSFNLVRGEDSIVRALHTGHPFLWQIYPQDENAHIIKLESFLDRLEQICREVNELALDSTAHAANHLSYPHNVGLSYLKIDDELLAKALATIRQVMLAYNGGGLWPENFNLDEFESLTSPVFYNFALYLCGQDNLCKSLEAFIKSKLAEI